MAVVCALPAAFFRANPIRQNKSVLPSPPQVDTVENVSLFIFLQQLI